VSDHSESEPLSPADEARLARAIGRLEDELYRAVLRRVVRTILIGTTIVVASITLVGWLSWSALRRNLVEGALSTLQTDDSLRSDMLVGLGIDTAGYARLVEMLAGSGSTDLDMAELERMLESLLGDSAASSVRAVPRR
jgi:hypothetical protein